EADRRGLDPTRHDRVPGREPSPDRAPDADGPPRRRGRHRVGRRLPGERRGQVRHRPGAEAEWRLGGEAIAGAVTTTAPAKRFLRAEWQALAMLNYEVDPAALAPYVPAGTEIDGWGGRVYVSMVGCRFLRTRVLGLAIPLHRDFDEVNLRFYVRRYAPDGLRRGVAFVKEVLPRPGNAWVAGAVYGERYVALPMRHEVALPDPAQPGTGHASYGWRFGDAWQRL